MISHRQMGGFIGLSGNGEGVVDSTVLFADKETLSVHQSIFAVQVEFGKENDYPVLRVCINYVYVNVCVCIGCMCRRWHDHWSLKDYQTKNINLYKIP